MTEKKTPVIRFTGYTDAWEKRQLGEVLIERKIQQPQSEEFPLVSFTVEKGVTPKTERYDREQLVVGEKGAKKYKVTKFDDIVYNPANLKFGAIARNKFGNAVFSPIYVTLEVDEQEVLPSYLEMIVTQRDFINYALQFQQGTVYERQSVSPEDLLSLFFKKAELPEQTAIGNFFAQLDRAIALQER